MAWIATIKRIDRSSEKIHVTVEYSDEIGLQESFNELLESPDEFTDTWLDEQIKAKLDKLSKVDIMDFTLRNEKKGKTFGLNIFDNTLISVDMKQLDPILAEEIIP